MKKLIKKNISVILSVALILGMMLPVFSGVVANAYTAENTVIKNNIDTACDNLIAEWNKLITTEGLDKLTPQDLFTEAAALDLSGFENTDAFVAARQNLANILINSYDPTELKNAWGNLYSVVSTDFYSPFVVTGQYVTPGTDQYKDATFFKSDRTNITLNTTSESESHIFGAKSVTFDYSLGMNRTGVTGTTEYEVFLCNDPEKIDDDKLAGSFSSTKKLYGMDDLQFSFVVNKINTAATGTKIGFKVTASINDSFSVLKSSYYVDINEGMLGKVQTVKFSDIVTAAGLDENWLEGFHTADTVSRIEMQLCDADSANNAAVNMTLGSVVGINYIELPTEEETANWNVSDWVYAAESINTDGVHNVDAFKTATEHAKELKEISGVEVSNTVSTYNDSEFNIYDKNLLEGIKPIVNYYDGVSNEKVERFSVDYKNLTDGNLNKTVSIEAGDFKNDGAFLEIVYNLGKNAVIEKAAVVSAYENALRNYKYKIYAAKTEADLFTKEALTFTYINRDSSWVQMYDFANGPELIAKYIAVRIYVPAKDLEEFDGFVRLNEFGVYGAVKDYDVSASEFSSNAVKTLGNNLLTGNSTKSYVRADTGNRQRFTGLFDEKVYPINYLYDADSTTQVAVGGNYRMYYDGDTTSLHIYYDLGDIYSIDKFLFASYAGTNTETGKYRIHASNDLNNLFNGKSVVVDYDNTVNTTRMQIFTMKNAVAARYVSFEVTLPLANYKAAVANNTGYEGTGIRISELGVYGGQYIKSIEKENLLSHVPVTLNRVDTEGNKIAVSQSEYGGKDHTFTYDEDYETFVSIKSNGNAIEYNYNLYQNAVIENIRFVSNSANISSVKFYASSSETAVNDESALVYQYKVDEGSGEKVFEKYFIDTSLTASYLKVVATISSGDFEIAEIEANGFNKNKADYENVVLNRTDYLSLYVGDTLTNEHMDKWLPAWSDWSDYQVVENAFDGDLGTIYTYYGGKNNDTSVNIFLNLQGVNCVDNVSVYTSLLEDYRPSKMNIFVGNSRDEVFSANATPIKQWTEKIMNDDETVVPDDNGQQGEDIFDGEIEPDISVDFDTGVVEGENKEEIIVSKEKTPAQMGLYAADFTPMEISCVRIEIVDCNPKYFSHINKVGGIISEIQINGFAPVGSAVDNVLESSKDMVMRALDPVKSLDNAGAVITNNITDGIEGEPAYTINGVGSTIADSGCDDQKGYIEFAQTNSLANTVILADIDDIYFSYKVKNAVKNGKVAARIYIYNGTKNGHGFAHYGNPATATVLYVDTSNTEWVHTSMSKQFGENWKDWLMEAHGAEAQDIIIPKIHLSWNNVGGAADMLFTGMYYTFNEGANPYYKTLSGTLGKNGQKAALTMSKYYTYDSFYGYRYGKENTAKPITSANSDTYYSLQGVGGEKFGNESCNAGGGSIKYVASSNVKLSEIDDIYLSYKIDKAIQGENVVARIYIYDENGDWAESFSAGTVRVFYFSMLHTDWNRISLRDVAGDNWKAQLVDAFNAATGTMRTAEEIGISEIRFGFNWTGEADMSFSNIYYQYTEETGSTISNSNATAVLNNAREAIDISTVAKKTAKEFKYNVQFLADYLNNTEKVGSQYISGNYKKTAADIKELALLAQYLDKTLGADDFMDPYCAYIDSDRKLTENDLLILRKQLLVKTN